MDIRRLAIHTFTLMFGFLLAWEIVLLAGPLALAAYSASGGDIVGLGMGYFLAQYLAVGAGGFALWYIFERRFPGFGDVFLPRGMNVLYSILIALLVLMLPILSPQVLSSYLQVLGASDLIMAIALSMLIYTVMFYPAASLATYLHRTRGKVRNRRKRLFGLGIVFNPVFLVIALAMSSLFAFAISMEPCGVSFGGFLPDSAARDAGMEPGEVMIRLNGMEVRDADDFIGMSERIPPQETVLLETREGGAYSLTRRYSREYGRHMYGITNVTTEFCPRPGFG